MKYRFYSMNYVMSPKISSAWVKEHGIVFNQGIQVSVYALLDEYQAILVRLQDPNVKLFPDE